MGRTALLTAAVIVLLVPLSALSQKVAESERLVLMDKGATYELTVPVSRLAMTIPKGGFRPSKPDAGSTSPRYFYLQDPDSALIISGWFEPEQAFSGMR